MHLNARRVRFVTGLFSIAFLLLSCRMVALVLFIRNNPGVARRSKRGEDGGRGEGGGGASLGVDCRCRRHGCQTHRTVRRFTPIARHQRPLRRHFANTARPTRRRNLLSRAVDAL